MHQPLLDAIHVGQRQPPVVGRCVIPKPALRIVRKRTAGNAVLGAVKGSCQGCRGGGHGLCGGDRQWIFPNLAGQSGEQSLDTSNVCRGNKEISSQVMGPEHSRALPPYARGMQTQQSSPLQSLLQSPGRVVAGYAACAAGTANAPHGTPPEGSRDKGYGAAAQPHPSYFF